MRFTLQASALAILAGPVLAQGSDTCATAPSIMGSGPFTFDCSLATTDGAGDPACLFFGNDQIFNDVWYSWTASDSGPHTASLCGFTVGDSRIAIYDGGCGSAVASCDDDGCGSTTPGSLVSQVSFSAVAGQSYLIRLGNFGDTPANPAVGDFTVNFTPPAQNPANGNFYAVVTTNLSWTDANAEAQGTLFQGVPGHLATLTSQGEIDWVLANLDVQRPWIGLSQNLNSPNYSEPAGGYEWVTGEPFAFDSWSPGEPSNNNQGQSEEFVEMFGNGDWNDATDFHAPTNQYIIEWEGNGAIGTNYCLANQNSTGLTGVMSASGSTIIASNDFTLTAADLPANQFGIFVTSLDQGFVPNAGGSSNGNICLGGIIGRFFLPSQIVSSGAMGEISLQVPLASFPQGNGFVAVMSGDTWNFQAWHRDSVGQGSNFTDGLQVTFL